MSATEHCSSCCCCTGGSTLAHGESAATVDSSLLKNNTNTFTIAGLDCVDCAGKLETAVRKLPGVTACRINFTAAKLNVVYDSTLVDAEAIVKVAEQMGYEAYPVQRKEQGLKTAIYRIAGLDCADCAAKLEKKVGLVPGVRSVKLNFGTGKLAVEHTLTDADILQAIAQAGYHGTLDSKTAGDAYSRAPWWRNARLLATAASALLLVVVTAMDWAGLDESILVPLYLLALLIGGFHTAKSGFYSLRSLTFDMNFLMSIAVIGAAFLGEWSEAAAVVVLFSLGNTLQAYAMDKTRKAITALMDLAPAEALVRRDDREVILAAADIQPGDIIIVKPGERIAMDGKVVGGAASVNQAAITGEAMPVAKTIGDEVYAGTINENGHLEIVVSKFADDSTLAKIMHMVEEAQAQKAPSQQFVDVFAKYYTPAVILGAVLITLVPWLMFQQPFTVWFYRALILLVIACPCALVISTPVSIVSALGNASRRGVLIKGGAYLEQMGAIRAVAFDKTGTLTKGHPAVTDIVPLADVAPKQLITLAASIERLSEHPVAKAIVAAAPALPNIAVTDFKAIIGKGVQANIEGQTVYVGNARLFAELGHSLPRYEQQLAALEDQGKTVMLVGHSDKILGLIAVADTLREDSAQAVQKLRTVGIENVVMLTGDNRRVAHNIAGTLKLDAVHSELLPADKVATIKTLAKEHGSVAMIGDGVNDAPALAAANIGIAMGVAGSDAALETADIALMTDDLNKLGYVVKLSRKTVAVVKQNIAISLIIKTLFLLMTLVGMSNLWMAVFADTGTALIVTLNGMRLMRELQN